MGEIIFTSPIIRKKQRSKVRIMKKVFPPLINWQKNNRFVRKIFANFMCRFTRCRFCMPAPESHRSVTALVSSHSHIPIGRLFSCQRTNIPSLITSGRGYFFGCFEKIFFILSLVPTGKGDLYTYFQKFFPPILGC